LTFFISFPVAQFAKASKLATLSYWNFNRDFPGGSISSQDLTDSSSPDQKQDSQFFTTFQSAIGSADNSIDPNINVSPASASVTPVDTSKIQQPLQKSALPPAGV
jgi:hypothetical protein